MRHCFSKRPNLRHEGDVTLLNAVRLTVPIGSLVVYFIVQAALGVTTAQSKSREVVSPHHREVIRSACGDMYPSKKIKRMKCALKMLKNAGSLFDFNSIPATLRNNIVRQCEGLKYGGSGEDRLKKYDSCLRESTDDVAPQKIPLPPKLAIKPYILLGISNCDDLPMKAGEALNTYKIKLKEYLKNHVRGVVFIKDSFISDFWCTNKNLYFRYAQKKHTIDRQFYALILNFKAKDRDKFILRYELYDIKTRGFIYNGRVNHASVNLSQSPSDNFNQLKNARNQILKQIIKYDPSN